MRVKWDVLLSRMLDPLDIHCIPGSYFGYYAFGWAWRSLWKLINGARSLAIPPITLAVIEARRWNEVFCLKRTETGTHKLGGEQQLINHQYSAPPKSFSVASLWVSWRKITQIEMVLRYLWPNPFTFLKAIVILPLACMLSSDLCIILEKKVVGHQHIKQCKTAE